MSNSKDGEDFGPKGGDTRLDFYQGLFFEPSVLRIALMRMRPRWAGPWPRMAGRFRWKRILETPQEVVSRADWVSLKPRVAGICGSDTAVFFGKSSAYLAPLASFPAVFGHEVVAQVTESRPGLPRGTRVVVDPTLGCSARGAKVWCPACVAGNPHFCRQRQDLERGPGMLLGYHARWPGGFSTAMWAPVAQTWVVPDAMTDARAVLTEPLATVLSGLEQVEERPLGTVLVIGAGTIGLLTAFACRHLWDPEELHVVTRYPHQAAWAKRLGADLVSLDKGFALRSREILGLPSYRGKFGAPTYYPGGYDVVIDAVGTAASVRQALAQTKPGGQLLQLGGAGAMRNDLTPLWARGIRWIGAYGYRSRAGISTFPKALSLLESTDLPIEDLVTHQYPLPQYAAALRVLTDRKVPAIKVVLTQSSAGHGDFGKSPVVTIPSRRGVQAMSMGPKISGESRGE